MTSTYRSNSYAVYWMPEATEGTDPGIVTAATVNGTSEEVRYQPQNTTMHGGSITNYRAYARLAAPPDGLPKRPMVPVEQVYPTTDYDPFHAKGLRGGQEFTLTFHVHGGLLDSGSQLDTDRPVPPPWLALCESASGRAFGHLAALTVGGGNLVGTNASKTVAAGADATYFDIAAESGTVGTIDEGMVLAVDFGTGTSTPDIELARVTHSGAATEYGDPDTTTSGSVYNGTNMGFSATPAGDDIVYFPCQVAFDRRYESVSPSFTILIMRPDVDTAYLCTGCKAKEFELTANFGEIPTIKITFVCIDAVPFSEGGTTVFGGTPTITDEPDYYSDWPCAKVIGSDELVFMNNTTVTRNLAISNLSLKWSAGYTPRHSNMAAEGTTDLRLTEMQDLSVSFTCLYRDEWRDILGACYAVDGTYGTFPLIYWSGEKRSQLWGFCIAAAHLKEDPGLDGDFEGNQAHTVTLGCRRYSGDTGNFATGTLVDNKWSLFTF